MGSSQSSLSTTVIGYIVVFALGGGYAFYYMNIRSRKDLGKVATQKLKDVDRRTNGVRKEMKAKKQRVESYMSDAKTSTTKVQDAPVPAEVAATVPIKDDTPNDQDFARRFTQAKEGTKFSAKTENRKSNKSVKQSQARESQRVASQPSIAAISPEPTPSTRDELPPTPENALAADSTGVADMLEPTTSSGPSVLRLTDTDEKPQASKPSKPSQPAETKKQRQNRRKAEEAKLAREDIEKDRKVLLEQQRRTAREAEGRAAKDGSAFLAAQKTNAWTTNGTHSAASEAMTAEFLDTFDPATALKPTAAPTMQAASTKPAAPKADWQKALPSEEEQMAMAKNDIEWSTVGTKKARKGKNNDGNSVSGGSNDDKSGQPAAPLKLTPDVGKPVAKPAKATATPANANGRPQAFGKQSSFAALTVEEPAEQETEWDV